VEALGRRASFRRNIRGNDAAPLRLPFVIKRNRYVTFTIEFMRVRGSDNAHAILDRVTNIASDLDEVKATAKALFATLDLPQTPDALRILDKEGRELFFWSPSGQQA
jgi:hypothetical protein